MSERPPELEIGDVVDVKSLSREELLKVPHDTWRMFCCVQGCNRFTRVKDFGLWPEVHGRFMSGDWLDINKRQFVCDGHWKFYNGNLEKAPIKYYFHIDTIKKTIWASSERPE